MARRPNDLPELWDESTLAADRKREANRPKESRLRRMAREVRDEVIPREGAGPTIGNSLFAIPSARVAAPSTGGQGLRLFKSARDAKNFRPNQTVLPTSRGFRNRSQIVSGNRRQIAGNVVDAATTAVRTPFSLTGAAGISAVAAASDLARDGEERYVPPERANTTSATDAARRSTDPTAASNNTSTPPQARSLLRRMEDGETLTQADFNAAGYDGQGLRVDGNRQGAVPQWMNDRMPESRASTAAGLRQQGGSPNIPQAAPVMSQWDMQQAERAARIERSSMERRVPRSMSPGRRAQAMENIPSVSELVQQRVAATIAGRSPNQAQTDRIGLRERARQANQTAGVTARGQDLNFQASREATAQRMLAQNLRGGEQNSVLGPGGSSSPENVRAQADTMARGIFSDLSRSNVGVFESEEETAAALDGFFQRAGTQQASGELPQWVDDTMGRDLFTLAAALSAAERRGGLGGLFGMTRGRKGQPELNPADTLRLIAEMVQNEGGNKWTRVGGQQFNLSKLEGNSARLYESLASRLRPMLEQEAE